MSKTNVVIALILGAVMGFVVGRVTGRPGSGGGELAAASDTGKTQADLPAKYLKEADLSMVNMSGLSEPQKYSLLKAMNEMTCDCGCSFGSIAECRKKDPNCPNSPKVVEQMLTHARAGKSGDQIIAAIRGGEAKPAQPQAARPAAEDPNTVYKVPVGGAHVKGKKDALVTIVEFSDFQCPFCSRVGPTLKQVEDTYGKKVRIAFKHNPLPFHPDAPLASEAALAAGEQGKFFEMHDKMFANQQAIKRPDLERYAQELGLNLSKFKAALDSGKFKQQIEADKAEAQKLGARGTPSFFINGRKLRGAQPFPAFQGVIDEELKKAEAMVDKGVDEDEVYDEIIKNGVEAPPPPPMQAAQPPPPAVRKIEIGDAPVKGPKYAPVTIVEWSDFQCPFCSRVGPTLKQIEETYGKEVRVVWKHQPLPFHQNAMPAAEAAEAARAEGKFWQMHDKLFSNQQALDRGSLERYAQELGLNMSKFKKALDEHAFKSRIDADAQYGMQVGANGTPTFFINGKLLSGAQPFESFKNVIDAELARAKELLKKGTRLEEIYEKVIAEGAAAVPAVAAAPPPEAAQNVDIGGAPVKGDPKAPVTIVEFSDFQCPFCGRVNPAIEQLMQEYKGKVKVAFKQNPLPFHPNATPAAEASLAAHEQGKFWEMHDKLFQNQQALDRASFERYAQEIGLNMSKFKAALDSGKYKSVVDADLKLAQSVGVSGTPTFFVNGHKLVGAQPYEQFKAAVEQELSRVAKK